MTAPTDLPALLTRALHQEVDHMAVTDSQRAASQLQATMRRNRRHRRVVGLAASAAAILTIGFGALALLDDGSPEPTPPVEQVEQRQAPGHRILFSDGAQLLLVDDRGGSPRAVADGTSPRYSPDGSQVAFVDGASLMVATTGVWEPSRLDERPAPADRILASPVWSPDGTQVAYIELSDDGSRGSDLRVVDLDTRQSTLVTSWTAPNADAMEWSPDGSSLLLGFDRSTSGGTMVVERLDLKTGELAPFLGGAGETTGVRYSPDGSQIAFYSDSRDCICVATADGSGVRIVLSFSGEGPDSARLAWSPQGDQLVWTARLTGRLYLLDVATGENRQLASGAGRASAVDWDHPNPR